MKNQTPKSKLPCSVFLPFSVAVALMVSACFNKPHINGMKSGQPIMDGWTHEQAGEFWLASTLTDKCAGVATGKPGWATPEELAQIDNVNVRVSLPVHASSPVPRQNTVYRQRSSGGFIIFRDTVIAGDTLNTVGVADFRFNEPGYFPMDSTRVTCRVQSRGKGVFLLYHLREYRKRDTGEKAFTPEWNAAVISVYPGGDSLLICRGNRTLDAYVAER